MSRIITQGPRFRETAFINLNEAADGGLPNGRLIEIYGRSQIGKSSFAIKLFPKETVVYIDLSRKICTDYLTDNVILAPSISDEKIFDAIIETAKQNVIIVIDDLTMLGTISDDSKRFKWLTHGFMRLQRELVKTESIVIVLNQIRISPNTGHAYNPHEGCLDPAVKIKMHFAEKKSDGDLVYLDIEKHFWGKQGARCTLLVSKNSVTVPTFYKPVEQIPEEDFL
jgi:RecA/RadA recombinase